MQLRVTSFPEIADKIRATSDFYSYEKMGTNVIRIIIRSTLNQVTVRYCWVREWGFEAYTGKSGGN